MQREQGRIVSIALALLVLGGVFFAGVYIGYENRPAALKVLSVTGKEPVLVSEEEKINFSPFWETWNAIDKKYTPANGTSTEVTAQDRVWGAIEGLVFSLGDPYSVFLPPDDSEVFEENIQGNFGGVGMEIGIRDNILTVISPLKNTPAFRAGIEAGDKILKVDDTLTADLAIDEAVKMIRGEVGTDVTLTMSREGKPEPFDVTITRAVITIPTIETELRNDGIFVIELYNFGGQSPRLFRGALREFVEANTDKLILDLRGNPGGFLEASVDIASWFLPTGTVIVTEDFGEGKEEKDITYRSRGYDIFNENLKMVILVDKGSASASEIVAGALSEHGIATLVGEQTFGKGSVQELIKITPDTSLKLTVAHWQTPEGTIISKGGITPEYIMEVTEEDRENDRDPQLEKAVELLLSGANN